MAKINLTIRVKKLIYKNRLLFIFFSILILVAITILYKELRQKSQSYVYAKIQINYPGSYYVKPDFWLANALKPGGKEYGLLAQPDAEILQERYYNYNSFGQYDIYITTKLSINYNKQTNSYSFQRSQISVGSPIQINFSSAQVNGTIIDLSNKPFKDIYVTKTVYLTNRGGYNQDAPDIYNQITPGDKWFDGTDNVVEIVGKNLVKGVVGVQNLLDSQIYDRTTDVQQNIVVVAKIKVLSKGKQLIFGGNQLVKIGNPLLFSTSSYTFTNSFVLTKIE